jgi:hypothetical protein
LGYDFDGDRVPDRQLHIDFQRSGGFTGITLSTSVDAGELPPGEAEELANLVDQANLPALAEAGEGPRPGGPDRFQYDLTVTRDESRYQVSVGETDVPDSLRPLLNRLLDLARRR